MNQREYMQFHENVCEGYSLTPEEQKSMDSVVLSLRGGGKADHARLLRDLFAELCEDIGDKAGRELIVAAEYMTRGLGRVDSLTYASACESARSLSLRKNNDYASPAGNTDPFAIFKNFLKCETLGICSVEAGFLVRLSDKVSRCVNLLSRTEGPSVSDETLRDTGLDIINYVCLLLAYIETKKKVGRGT